MTCKTCKIYFSITTIYSIPCSIMIQCNIKTFPAFGKRRVNLFDSHSEHDRNNLKYLNANKYCLQVSPNLLNFVDNWVKQQDWSNKDLKCHYHQQIFTKTITVFKDTICCFKIATLNTPKFISALQVYKFQEKTINTKFFSQIESSISWDIDNCATIFRLICENSISFLPPDFNCIIYIHLPQFLLQKKCCLGIQLNQCYTFINY